jgi:hypothetical protein
VIGLSLLPDTTDVLEKRSDASESSSSRRPSNSSHDSGSKDARTYPRWKSMFLRNALMPVRTPSESQPRVVPTDDLQGRTYIAPMEVDVLEKRSDASMSSPRLVSVDIRLSIDLQGRTYISPMELDVLEKRSDARMYPRRRSIHRIL